MWIQRTSPLIVKPLARIGPHRFTVLSCRTETPLKSGAQHGIHQTIFYKLKYFILAAAIIPPYFNNRRLLNSSLFVNQKVYNHFDVSF